MTKIDVVLCVCKISFKSVQVCGGCCKMFRGLTFWDTVYKRQKQRVCVQLQSSFTLRAASKTKQSANVRQLGVVSPAATSGSGARTPPIAQTACRAGHRRRQHKAKCRTAIKCATSRLASLARLFRRISPLLTDRQPSINNQRTCFCASMPVAAVLLARVRIAASCE